MTEEIKVIPTNGTSAEDVAYAKKVKEIYIDGVNVAGCEFAVKPKNDNRIKCHCAKGLLQIAKMQEQPESIKSGLCENNPDCCYKQLKRAENTVNECHKYQVELENKIERLEQENQELKEKIIKLTEENGNLIINRNTVENKQRDTESRLISIQKANTHNLVLLQRRNNALEEIREIAMGIMDDDIDEGSAYYDANQIINKINEVLEWQKK